MHLAFDITAPARMPALARIFDALRAIKAQQFGEAPPGERARERTRAGAAEAPSSHAHLDLAADDPRWHDYLDEAAKRHFEAAFDYESSAGTTYRRLWALTHPSRRSDPIFTLPGPWDFGAVLHALYDGEYLLDTLTEVEPGHGVLTYTPLAGPFGGTESLVQLVEAFGQRVTFDAWHDGPHARPEVGWDLERAARLVAAGKGAGER